MARKQGNRGFSAEAVDRHSECVAAVQAAETLRSLYIQYQHKVGIFSLKCPSKLGPLPRQKTRSLLDLDGQGDLVLGAVSRRIFRNSFWYETARKLRQYELVPEMYFFWVARFYGAGQVYINALRSTKTMDSIAETLSAEYFPDYGSTRLEFFVRMNRSIELLGFEKPLTNKNKAHALNYTISLYDSQLDPVYIHCLVSRLKESLGLVQNKRRIMLAAQQFCLYRSFYERIWGLDRVAPISRITDKLIATTRNW